MTDMTVEVMPTIDEVEGLIVRNRRMQETWSGSPAHVRNLDIELCALRMLRDHLMEPEL